MYMQLLKFSKPTMKMRGKSRRTKTHFNRGLKLLPHLPNLQSAHEAICFSPSRRYYGARELVEVAVKWTLTWRMRMKWKLLKN